MSSTFKNTMEALAGCAPEFPVISDAQRALIAIAKLGGNLPDHRLTDKTGPNDARQRGLMYVEARRLARKALGLPAKSSADDHNDLFLKESK